MNKNKTHIKEVTQIQDFSEFITSVQDNALQIAFIQLSLNPTVLKNLPQVLDGSISLEKILFYVNRLMFSKNSNTLDYDSEDLYINNADIPRLVSFIANDMISFALNKLVDQKKLYMCWDKKVKDFLWVEKLK